MLNFKKIIGMLILNSASLFLWSQCPDDLNVNIILKTNDIEKVIELTSQLENCLDQQDSLAFSFHKLGIFLVKKKSGQIRIVFDTRILKHGVPLTALR